MLTPVLRHPVMQPLKRAIRNAWWRYRGQSIVNPPLPAGVRSVLFVCLGNICRSPFAAVTAAKRAGTGSLDGLHFSSAGLRTKPGAEPPEEARQTAELFDVTLAGHRPRALTRELMDAHDMILVMEGSQMDLLRTMYPDLRNRVFLLPLFDEGTSGLERYSIEDPFGLPRPSYEACYRRIDRAVVALLTALAALDSSGKHRRSAMANDDRCQ
jgi:protein-tyrosine phosphatase